MKHLSFFFGSTYICACVFLLRSGNTLLEIFQCLRVDDKSNLKIQIEILSLLKGYTMNDSKKKQNFFFLQIMNALNLTILYDPIFIIFFEHLQ